MKIVVGIGAVMLIVASTCVIIAALFPPKETMRRRYAFAARHAWLLPATYLARIFGYLFHRHDTARTLSTAETRSELMRQYGIF